MDPAPRPMLSDPATGRLPRACGDGPSVLPLWRPARGGFPRMRGWTLPPAERRPGDHGFPAHAGMDPSGTPRRRRRGRLPHACGDGPSTSSFNRTPMMASPRMRGWTCRCLLVPHRGCSRLPRACGDGPEAATTGTPAATASPRMRGWTPARSSDPGGPSGFPAHAGMDPRPRAICCGPGSRRLPRACGDGPTG